MSMTTEWVLAKQEERANEWIREYLGDEEADENSDGWDDAVEAYDSLQDYLNEQAEQEAEYLQYLTKNPHQLMFKEFNSEILYLQDFLSSAEKLLLQKQRTYKLVYVHLVTLLETYLGDTIKSVVLHDERMLLAVIKNVKEFKTNKFSYEDLIGKDNIVQSLVIEQLSKIMYHNIPKVLEIYKAVLGKPFKINQDDVNKIILVRHDLVHRNGKTVDNDLQTLEKSDVDSALSNIKKFVEAVHIRVNSLLNESKERIGDRECLKMLSKD